MSANCGVQTIRCRLFCTNEVEKKIIKDHSTGIFKAIKTV